MKDMFFAHPDDEPEDVIDETVEDESEKDDQ